MKRHGIAVNSTAGKWNMAFGVLYLLFTLIVGLYITGKFGLHVEDLTGSQKNMLTSALLQANIDSIFNIVAGYLIYRMPFVGWLSRAVSALMFAGALLHSGMLYLAGFGLLSFAMHLIPVGGTIIISVMLVMGISVLSIRVIR